MINESITTLQNFNIFSDFDDKQCAYIKNNAVQMVIPKNKVLLKQGAEHNIIFILLKGELKLTAKDTSEEIIQAGSLRAKNSIAQIRPSLYNVSSLTQVKIISFSEDILDHAKAMKQEIVAEKIIAARSNIQQKTDPNQDKIIVDIINLLHTNKLVLPSMPDIAIKIRHAMEDVESDLNDVIKVINLDPSITTKIINTANSAMYNISGIKVENCKSACMRLGGKVIMNLILSYTMKELFHSDLPLYQNKMQEMWQQSINVAAISSVLARLTPGFDPEKALLAGLLHNVGSVVIINYLSTEKIIIEDPDILHNFLHVLQAEVGETLLSRWGFSDDLINVAKYSTNLYHNKSEQADYIDIVNIAQIHAYIGTPVQEEMPIINQIPAFTKLALGQLTPELSIQVLHTSQAEIEQTISLFN